MVKIKDLFTLTCPELCRRSIVEGPKVDRPTLSSEVLTKEERKNVKIKL